MSTAPYTVEIQGLDGLLSAMNKYPTYAGQRFADAINKSLAILAKNGTDKNFQFKTSRGLRSGYLQASWGTPGQGLSLASPSNLIGRIWTNAKYAIFVHEGTAAHIIRAVRAKVLANQKAGLVFGPLVHHPGNAANRFLPRIISASQDDIDDAFSRAGELLAQDISATTA